MKPGEEWARKLASGFEGVGFPVWNQLLNQAQLTSGEVDGQVPPAARRLRRHKTRCCMKNAFVVIAQSVLLTTVWLCRTSGSTENLHSRFHGADKLIDYTKASCLAVILNTAKDWHHCTLVQVFHKESTKGSVFTCGTPDDPLSLVQMVGQRCFRSTAGTSVIQIKFSNTRNTR